MWTSCARQFVEAWAKCQQQSTVDDDNEQWREDWKLSTQSTITLMAAVPVIMGAGTWGAGWATAHPGENQGGPCPPWKY